LVSLIFVLRDHHAREVARLYKGAEWDVQKLREDLQGPCTSFVAARIKKRLPFPADLTVSDIEERDIDLLANWIELSENDRYSYWRRVFIDINDSFAENHSEANSLLSQTRKLLPGPVPLAPAFLLLWEAYLSKSRKESRIEDGSIKSLFSNSRNPRLERGLSQLFDGDNDPMTRRKVAHGSAVIRACVGLIALLQERWERKRGPQKVMRSLMKEWGLEISSDNVADWRRRGYEMP